MKTPKFLLAASLLLLWLAMAARAEDWVNTRLNEDTTTELQNEQQIVVNPTNPENLVAVWRDFRLGYRQVGYGYSFDGGLTWTNPGLFVDPHYPRDSDPALTVNAEGDYFAMLLAYTGSTNEPDGMLLYRSTDGGQSWEDRGFAVNATPGVFEDKEFVACDRTASPRHGRLYVVWDRFSETNIYCVASGNEGDSWTSPRRVSDDAGNQFPTPAVGPDGTLYVAWTYFFDPSIRIDHSTDGGLTFGSDLVVTPVDDPQPTLLGGISAPAHPAMDIDVTGDLFNGRIYIAYIDRVGSSDFDIYVRHSDDGGASWSSRTRINDDTFDNGRDQFHPWLTVDNSGTVTAVWLDRRQDPGNLDWYCYISQSTDGGKTWTPNQQVSTAPSSPSQTAREGLLAEDTDELEAMEPGALTDPNHEAWASSDPLYDAGAPGAAEAAERGNRPEGAEGVDGARPTERIGDNPPVALLSNQDVAVAGVIGEYIGVASWDGYVTTVWTDTRNGNQDTYGGARETAVAIGEPETAPAPAALLRAAPNPAAGPVELSYRVPADGWVKLEVFDVRGRQIRTLVDRNLRNGEHRFVWDGTNQVGDRVSPGSYWVRLSAPQARQSVAVRVYK
jgi:hypothetical protein